MPAAATGGTVPPRGPGGASPAHEDPGGTDSSPPRPYPGPMDGADRFMLYGLVLVFLCLLLGFVVALVVG